MTLLITVFAAIISTIVWYMNDNRTSMKIGMLPVMYWGASLMWLVDAIFEYIELQEAYFTPSIGDMANDAFLGLAVVAFAMTVWIIRLLLHDPKGVVKEMLMKKNVSDVSKKTSV